MLEVVLPWFAIGTAAMANGLCRAAVGGDGAAPVGDRASSTPARSCATCRNLRARLAQMSVRTEQSRALLGHTLGEIEAAVADDAAVRAADAPRGARGGARGDRPGDEGLRRRGVLAGTSPVERLFRDARAGWVMAPTVDHLDDFIGKALTGLPLF